MEKRPVIAVVGGGAAGCFAAANLSRMLPKAKIIIFEAGKKPLVKVGMTGGGRCNLTNTFESVDS
ncbi:MAG: NAD(P)/FAD-dependent oxidoreductase, partial [Bacteroidales bacterium]|nr:NAD(P)/FAD-dependent oxidoreductase [Bacteroidales bacterium]